MAGQTVALNNTQKIVDQQEIGSATTQNFVMYTCPAGKIAKVVGGSMYIDSYGSDTNSRLRYNGTTVMNFNSTNDPTGTSKDAPSGIIEATQTITKNGDSSGNSNMRFNLVIQESPA